jgi:hypothetical protein
MYKKIDFETLVRHWIFCFLLEPCCFDTCVSIYQPPPPGVAPSQAQLAAMQGHQVVGSQQGTSWISGGRNDGGYTWGF